MSTLARRRETCKIGNGVVSCWRSAQIFRLRGRTLRRYLVPSYRRSFTLPSLPHFEWLNVVARLYIVKLCVLVLVVAKKVGLVYTQCDPLPSKPIRCGRVGFKSYVDYGWCSSTRQRFRVDTTMLCLFFFSWPPMGRSFHPSLRLLPVDLVVRGRTGHP